MPGRTRRPDHDDLAKVQLVTDNNSSAGALVERTLVRAWSEERVALPCSCSTSPRSPTSAGDSIITAGIDGVYPRGITIGTVVRSEPGKSLFKIVGVKPAADFGTIEEVIVIHTRKIPPAVVRYAP